MNNKMVLHITNWIGCYTASYLLGGLWGKLFGFLFEDFVSDEGYATMMHVSVQTDKGYGDATAYWYDAFGGSLTTMHVDYVILEYVKAESES